VAWIADQYRDIICGAMSRGDDRQICEIAAEFYDRLFSRPVKDWSIGKVVSDGATWAIQLSDQTWLVRCCTTKQWSISDRAEVNNLKCKQHHVAEKMGAPLAYLEGLYDGVRSLEEFHGTSLATLQDKIRAAQEASETQLDLLLRLQRQVVQRKKQLANKRVIQQVMARATVDGVAMPDPPVETITVDNAKHVFKRVSGIYFIYRDQRLWYVGKAYDISKRLKTKTHPSQCTDLVSVVRLPRHRVHVAELYYIWKYRPPANGEVRKEASDEQRFKKQENQSECAA
jgi:hypothetical protein